jgi:endoglucanase
MLRFTLSAVLALTIAASLPATAQTPPQAPSAGFKRCINLGNALDAPHEGDWGYTITQADIVKIRQAGFDSVRIPIRWSDWAGTVKPYKLDPVFLKRVDQVTAWALAEGLTTIINVHHYEAFNDNPTVEYPRLRGIWANLSKHYRYASPKLVFEILNEPGTSVPDGYMDKVNAGIVATIRRYNPTRKVIYGNNNWNKWQNAILSRPPRDPNVILSFHHYDPITFTHQGVDFGDGPMPTGVTWGGPQDRVDLKTAMNAVADWAVRNNQPVFMGEFGVRGTVPLSERAKWITAVRYEAEKRNFAWCNWALHAEFDAMDGAGNWIPEIKKALLGP